MDGRRGTEGADCGDDYTCDTQAPGGYCLYSPRTVSSCTEDAQCPPGTLCSPKPWHAISGVCMRRCQLPADCREGYVCQIVELFAGEENGPKSSAPACWYVREM
ncbi:MAG: hypothetical protein H0U74_01980 [Bradymonadaceae bacterium]|nr:hypothetical protein [Lujinxingiaceae bacterium]